MYAAQSGMHSCKRIKLIFFFISEKWWKEQLASSGAFCPLSMHTISWWSLHGHSPSHFIQSWEIIIHAQYIVLPTLCYSMMDHSTTKNLPLAWKKAFSRTVSLRNIYFYMFSHPKRILVYTYLRISFLKLVRVGPTPGKTMLLWSVSLLLVFLIDWFNRSDRIFKHLSSVLKTDFSCFTLL